MSFLPGWFPGAAGVDSVPPAPLTTLSQVLSATDASGAAFTLPVGILAGDLIVVLDVAYDLSAPTTAVPADFTPDINVTGNDGTNHIRLILSHKIAVGTESGASVNGMDADLEGKLTYVFRGDVPILTATALDPGSQVTAGNPTAQVVNASGGTPPLIVLGGYVGALTPGGVSPRTFSTTKGGEINVDPGGDLDTWLAFKIYNSGPADSSIDMDDEGTLNGLVSCYIACA